MREHLDTMPVWDAMRAGSECPICALRARAERSQIEHYLGDSVMEPDTRVRVNAHGFCARHHAQLYREGNRLGHALMLSTHLEEMGNRLDPLLVRLNKQAEAYSGASLGDKVSGRGRDTARALNEAAAELTRMADDCVICTDLQSDMKRYLHTFFYLWAHEADFRKAFAEGKGTCVPDAALLAETALDELPRKEVAPFVQALTERLRQGLTTVKGDVDWLIHKYDYRFDADPWNNAKDSVERATQKLGGQA